MALDIVAEFDIDVDQLLSKSKETKKTLEGLKLKLKDLGKDKSSDTFIKTETALKKASTEYRVYTKALQTSLTTTGTIANVNTKLNDALDKSVNSIEGAKASTKELKEIRDKLNLSTEEGARANDAINEKLNDNKNFISDAISGNETLANSQDRLTNAMDREVTSVDEARESNKELLSIRNKLDLTSEEGLATKDSINEKLNENNKLIKDNVSGYEQQKIGIGGYQEAIEGALGGTKVFGVSLSSIYKNSQKVYGSLVGSIKGFLGYSSAQGTATVATSASTVATTAFGVSLAATGIGAIVVVLGLLIGAFFSTQTGIDKVNQVLAPLKGYFQGLIGVFQEVATAINVFDAVKDAFTILTNNFLKGTNKMRLNWAKVFGNSDDVSKIQKEIAENQKEFNQAIERTKERASKLNDIYEQTGPKLEKARDAQVQIEEMTIAIGKAENDLIISKATALDKMKEQEEIAKNTTLSSQERNRAIEEAKKLSNELAESETHILDLKIEQMRFQQSQNDTSRSDVEELNKLIAQRTVKQTEARARDLKFIGQSNSLAKEREAKAKKYASDKKKRVEKAQQDAIKNNELLLELYILRNNKENSSLADKIKFNKNVYQKEIELIEQRANAGASAKETELAKEKARLKLLEDNSNATLENATKELEIYISNNQNILNSKDKLNNELLSKQKDFLKEREALEIASLDKSNMSFAEYEAKKHEIKQNTANEIEAKEKEKEQATREERIINRELDNQLEIESMLEQDAVKYEIDLVKNEQAKEKALQDVEFSMATEEVKAKQIELINSQHATSQENINKTKNDAKLKGANDVLGGISELLGKETAAGKASAIAQATMNTWQGVARVWATRSILPEPFATAMKVVSTATTIASGKKAISAIRGTPTPKASKGITLKGNSHYAGGVGLYDANGNLVVEAEGGENVYAITNKEASSEINKRGLLGALSHINQNIGNGIPLNENVTYASSGGLVQSNLKKSTNINKVVDSFENSQRTLKVVNIASETTKVAGEIVKVTNSKGF